MMTREELATNLLLLGFNLKGTLTESYVYNDLEVTLAWQDTLILWDYVTRYEFKGDSAPEETLALVVKILEKGND